MGVGRRRKGDMPERKTLQLSIHNEHMYSRKQKSSIFRGKIQKLDETLHAECTFQMKKYQSQNSITHFEFSRTL